MTRLLCVYLVAPSSAHGEKTALLFGTPPPFHLPRHRNSTYSADFLFWQYSPVSIGEKQESYNMLFWSEQYVVRKYEHISSSLCFHTYTPHQTYIIFTLHHNIDVIYYHVHVPPPNSSFLLHTHQLCDHITFTFSSTINNMWFIIIMIIVVGIALRAAYGFPKKQKQASAPLCFSSLRIFQP